MNSKTILFLVGGVCVVGIAAFALWRTGVFVPLSTNGPVACTMEAMQCPDGSYVGRTGPSCAFAPCPTDTTAPTTVNWIQTTDTSQGVSFKYPPTLGTTYIQTTDWPPKVTSANTPLTCTEAGAAVALTGKTEQKSIGGRTFCVTTETEGAAGSMYLTYTYATEINTKTVSFTFGLKEVQCANYPEPKATACAKERQAFNPDTLAGAIVDTVTIK